MSNLFIIKKATEWVNGYSLSKALLDLMIEMLGRKAGTTIQFLVTLKQSFAIYTNDLVASS